MPISKKRNKERMQAVRLAKRLLLVAGVMSPGDVRAMRRMGLNPEDVGEEAGQVAAGVFYALLRDRDAIKSHLGWHHEAMRSLDIGTVVERQAAELATLRARATQHEADHVVWETGQRYTMADFTEDEEATKVYLAQPLPDAFLKADLVAIGDGR